MSSVCIATMAVHAEGRSPIPEEVIMETLVCDSCGCETHDDQSELWSDNTRWCHQCAPPDEEDEFRSERESAEQEDR